MYVVHASGESHVIISARKPRQWDDTPEWRSACVLRFERVFRLYGRRTHAGTNKQTKTAPYAPAAACVCRWGPI